MCRCEFLCVSECNEVYNDNINDADAQVNQTDQGLLFQYHE